jgi:hypothetical protein
MKDVSFACNALISGREAIAPLRLFTLPAGNWIRGTVALRSDHLAFSMNSLSALHQADGSSLSIPYREISACSLGRLAVFLTTVDLKTARGAVRFRCLYRWNQSLLAEVQNRIAGA